MGLRQISGQRAWVISADMGLGHQRAAYPLRGLGGGEVHNAVSPALATAKEIKLWQKMRRLYETLSRLNDLPLVGGFFFGLLDKVQAITPYYPFRDLSGATPQVNYLQSLIDRGLGKQIATALGESGLPLITTFYAVALAAAGHGYPDVYLVATDADLNRVWAAKDPLRSRIHYFTPCSYTVNRLREYGVPDERIWLTGFPLPKENLGSADLEILKADLGRRLVRLDPGWRFWSLHRVEAEYYLTSVNCRQGAMEPPTLTFVVGGAGAQQEIGAAIIHSLKARLQAGAIRLNLVCGLRPEVRDYFGKHIKIAGIEGLLGKGLNLLVASTLEDYFIRFNQMLRSTDILWTKPSELSFYAGLGLPVIMSPPLGAHEHINKKWLLEINAGISQQDPALCAEWLFDLLNEGRLAEAAWNGFLKARKCGTFKIEEILATGTMTRERSPLHR